MNDQKNHQPSNTNQPQPHDPFLADELDVLEAVAKLEQKYGKKILTEEQRGKLLQARRGEGGQTAEVSVTKINQLKSIGGIGQKEAEWLVAALRAKLKNDISNNLGKYSWDSFSEKQKQYVISCYFQLVYGTSEYHLAELLAGGGKNA
ncbi:hypothetical protein A2W24_00395 [Microgenomates group bacterium RBG_16_45_19]|nr:MAG: hypothetical protein A2W24_00395 [Microgenomates group bacterium RBG_16_45_19]